ncbi:hypothetical protein KY290_027572 [Solanum tuberosum]|uniref:Integrase zinc-binding domain-containing protein n=1 Tax=Solanum tuberosum TaxID=4113 RepID=A0ABQ7UFE6_SOLTU|nr:hypothetical protein KY290_027572 [Solanum tuberosum]
MQQGSISFSPEIERYLRGIRHQGILGPLDGAYTSDSTFGSCGFMSVISSSHSSVRLYCIDHISVQLFHCFIALFSYRFRFSASRSRLDRFPIFSSATSVVLCPCLGGSSGRDKLGIKALGKLHFLDIRILLKNNQQVEGDKLREIAKFRQDQNSMTPGSKSQGSVSGNRTYLTCPKCGKNHPGKCLAGKEGYFGCGQSEHWVKNCLSAKNGQEGGGQRQNRLYALPAPQDQEDSPDVITGQKKLNLRQRRWLEFLKHYDMRVHYHLGKENVVADAFSRLSMSSVAHVEEERRELAKDVHRLARLGFCLMSISDGGVTVQNGAESSLVVEVKEKQDSDPILLELKSAVHNQRMEILSQGGDGVLRYQGILSVPDVGELRHHIVAEAHNSRYSIHPGATKMYCDLREDYWWNGIKRDIADFVAKCPNCQQVKVEHLKPGGMTQDIDIPTWKWEVINMDFITGLPGTRRQHDSI